jgi:hypothetical protein
VNAVVMPALIALSTAAPPGAAQQVAPGTLAAIAHVDADHDSRRGRMAAPEAPRGPTVSTRDGSRLPSVFARFESGRDSRNEVRGLIGATVISGDPILARDIFAAIRA